MMTEIKQQMKMIPFNGNAVREVFVIDDGDSVMTYCSKKPQRASSIVTVQSHSTHHTHSHCSGMNMNTVNINQHSFNQSFNDDDWIDTE